MTWQHFKLKYKGVLDMAGLVHECVEWYENNGFEYYIYQTKSKATDFGTEEEFGISGWYNETEFHRIDINIYIHLWDVAPVEIIEGGEKKALTKAALSINGKGKLEYDFQGRFKKSSFTKKLLGFMKKYVINERYDAIWEDDLHYKVNAFSEHLKKYLDMNSNGKYF